MANPTTQVRIRTSLVQRLKQAALDQHQSLTDYISAAVETQLQAAGK